MNDVCYLTLCENSYPKKLAFNFLEELQREFDIQHGAEVSKAKRPYSFIKFGMQRFASCVRSTPSLHSAHANPRHTTMLPAPVNHPFIRRFSCTHLFLPSPAFLVISLSSLAPPDTFIQKTRKVYTDTRSQRNLNKVTEELTDVHRIMTKNITDILGRGEKIQSMYEEKQQKTKEWNDSRARNKDDTRVLTIIALRLSPFFHFLHFLFLSCYVAHSSGVASKADELLSSTAAYKKMAKDLNTDMFLRKYGPVIVVLLIVFLVLYFRFF